MKTRRDGITRWECYSVVLMWNLHSLPTKLPHTVLIYRIFFFVYFECMKLRHMNYSLPLVQNESITGNHHNLRYTLKIHRLLALECSVKGILMLFFHWLSSSEMLSWMFTPSFDAIIQKLYIKSHILSIL